MIRNDLKGDTHVEYVIAKAANRLHALRLLKRVRVMPEDMLKVYTCNVRSTIPAYLSDAIESIQKRALRIIFPNSSCRQALDQANSVDIVSRSQDIYM